MRVCPPTRMNVVDLVGFEPAFFEGPLDDREHFFDEVGGQVVEEPAGSGSR